MNTDPAQWAGGGGLIVAAVLIAVHTTRVLLRYTPHHRSPVPGLIWLLTTTALAVTGAALWATPGTSLAHTWPFAVALVIAFSPIVAVGTLRRRRPAPDTVTNDGRRAPK